MHRPPAYFVTGTDTEVGKTFVSCALLQRARRAGQQALAMKPVAAGCDAEGRNEDVEQLIAAAQTDAPRDWLNPYRFHAPIAPHLAAREEMRTIEPRIILDAFERLRARSERLLVEGIGGFRVPLSEDYDTADLACALGLPVILVVGLRLGCLNHALLSAEAIAARGLLLAGWVANRLDPHMAKWQENVDALSERLSAPLLGVLPRLANPNAAANLLRWPDEQTQRKR